MRDKIVISLSTIPPRFQYLGRTIKCLLDQDRPVDEIQLYLPKSYRRFPGQSYSIPELPPAITINIVDQDLGPATKVLYCAKKHWGTKTRIIYCDDDHLPSRTWVKSIIRATKSNPEKVIVSRGLQVNKFLNSRIKSHRLPRALKQNHSYLENAVYVMNRIHQKATEKITKKRLPKPKKSESIAFCESGFVDIAEGCGGVSIKPEFISKEAFKVPSILWTVDDIWLSGLLEYQNIGIWVDKSIPIPADGFSARVDDLYNYSTQGYDRKSANIFGIKYMQDKYSIWK